jgi:hypothetical protein
LTFGGVQFPGSSCSSLVIGLSAMRARTSASHACGSMSLSFAVYADRRTMPINQLFANVSGIIAGS